MKHFTIQGTRQILFAAVIVLLSGCLAYSQAVSGTLFGTVRDPSGAVVPGVKIVATNVQTGAVRRTTTSSLGTYQIPGVLAGVYTMRASIRGFKSLIQSGIDVTVGANVSVDFSLSIGQPLQTLRVTGTPPQIETTNATISGVVGATAIRQLPLNGRDWLQLATLQPGVIGGVGQTPTTGSSASSSGRAARGNGEALDISGGRDTENVFLIDGLIVNDYTNAGPGSTLGVNLGVDAIQEFSVLSSDYTAQYGFSSGGIVNSVLKSGTNQIHGDAYYFLRNSALDSRNFFDIPNIPEFIRNQFGGSVGGPIQKDKTFFFANFESLRQNLGISEASNTLSVAARNGDLTTGPVTVAPNMVPYLAAFPLPNGPVTGDTALFFFGGKAIGNEYYTIGKINHNFSDRTMLYGSYSFDNTANTLPDPYDEKLIGTPSRRQNVILSLDHVFKPTLLNTARVGVSRTHAEDADDISAISPNPIVTSTSFGFVPGEPAGIITVPGTTGFAGGLGASGADHYNYTAPQASDDLTWIKGRHTVKIGGIVDRIEFDVIAGNVPNGEWDYGSISDFLTSAPALDFTSDFPGANLDRGMRTTYLGTYIQDDYRIRPNLTLNLGVRYEFATPVSEAHNKIANLRNITDASVTIGAPYYQNPTTKDFQPRLGVAWDPTGSGKTAIRAGFGMFDILPLPYLFINELPRSVPFAVEGTVNNPSGDAFPAGGLSLLTPSTNRADYVQFNPSRAYVMNWNFSIERQLASTLALTVAYVGSGGVHEPVVFDDFNQVPPSLVTTNASGQLVFPTGPTSPQVVNPNFGRIQSTQWEGQSTYNALEANLAKQFAHGLAFQVAYTWSKSMDEGSATFGHDEYLNGVDNPWPFDARLQRGVSDYNVPQNLVVNYTWNVPSPASIKSPVPRFLLSGWQLGGVFQAHSGTPFTLTIAGDQANTGTDRSDEQRPNFNAIPGCTPNAINPGQFDNYVKLQCFSYPAFGTLGNLGRNTLQGPGMTEFDFSLFKNEALFAEKLKVQFRAEFFNVLNNTNFELGAPEIFDSSGTLEPTAGLIGPPTLTTARQIQFGLKLLW
ncbi:MAG: TonB-dependent receptor domain-containing protein [Terriglobia bacterium]